MGKDQELLEAARNGNHAVVEKILSQRAKRSGPLASLRRGPGANVQDSSGYSALHHAALNGHKDVVELLLKYEASCNIVDNKGSSPLHLAAWTGDVDIVRVLLTHGPSVPNVNLLTKDNETALHCAAQYGHTGVVGQLLENSCDPSIRNSREETALDLAAQYGRLETVELLVRTHPELIQAYSRGEAHLAVMFPHTPLHLASRNGHRAVVEVLLTAGVDVNVRTTAGTALHEAALCGKVEVVRTLLEAGVDLRIRDSSRKSVVDIMRELPTTNVTHEIICLIRKHRASSGDLSDDDRDGLPPIPNTEHLGSPYENVRPPNTRHSGHSSSPGTSPSHWDMQRQRVASSAMSIGSENSCGRSLDWSDGRELDQISLSSAASSTSNRRQENPYLPMGGSLSPSSNCKVSPTPPKKPPRRNLSVSPTHLQPGDLSYEYMCLARSGKTGSPGTAPTPNRRDIGLRRGKSADQYVEMQLRHIDLGDDSQDQYEQVTIRTINPKRKLRRLHDRSYENCEPTSIPVVVAVRRDSDASPIATAMEGGGQLVGTPISALRRPLKEIPLSPTHYQQPPTPDHPPPSAQAAERSIHERIRPLSQEYQYHKRRSRDMETETDDDLLVCAVWTGSLSGSICSSISLHSDKSVSTDNNVEEYVGDAPFAGLLKGSTAQALQAQTGDARHKPVPAERPKTLRRLKHVYDVPLISRGESREAREARQARELQEARECLLETREARQAREAIKEAKDKLAAPPVTVENGSDDKAILLSPFDEQEEWNKISKTLASFGSTLVQELQDRLVLSRSPSCVEPLSSPLVCSSIGQWLHTLGLADLEQTFLSSGYDDLDFLAGVLEDQDLQDMGISSDKDRETILEAAQTLPCRVKEIAQQQRDQQLLQQQQLEKHQLEEESSDQMNESENATQQNSQSNGEKEESAVDAWLRKIRLEQYENTFRKHLYSDMERVRRIWEVELTALLEVSKVGHRRRMLASVSGGRKQLRSGSLNPDPGTPGKPRSASSLSLSSPQPGIAAKPPQGTADPPVCSSPSAEKPTTPCGTPSSTPANPTGTLRHSHKKTRPAPPPPAPDLSIRDPSELLVGFPATLTTTWRHRPNALVGGSVSYLANYLGSTVVKELRGTESTKKSIQKLKRAPGEPKTTPDIVLCISYRGVKFLNPDTQELVCEHEIRNIHCACQDSDDLTHFAYITKDHLSNSHFCHVFYVLTMDQATEVIMTLGQAFEVAYQMALRDQAGERAANGHARSQSTGTASLASPIISKTPDSPCITSTGPNTPSGPQHARSLSSGSTVDHPTPRLVLAEDL